MTRHGTVPDTGFTVTLPDPGTPPQSPRRSTGPQRTAGRLIGLIGAALIAVIVLSYLLSREGVSELQRARRRVADLETRIQLLEVENRKLEAEIESLRESSFAMERIAREQLGMARDGEIIYMLPDDEAAAGTGQKR